VIQLHRGVVGREELPESQPAIEQYLLLLESVEHLRDLVSDDRASANVMIRANNNGSNDLLRVARFAEIWWREHGPAGYSARVTGIMYEYARSEHALERGQITGLGSALASVAVIFAFAFRSPRIAAIGLIPNLVSLALAFGGMGLLGISLDAGTVFLGSLALGIAVDDTLHVIAAFEQQRRSGRDPGAALEAALRETLPPVVYTSAILALGFSVLGFSSFRLTQNLGIGTACAMAICVLAGAFLLPPLLLSFPGRQRERFPNARASTAGAARPKH
jgi:predicted RND superfamily exporter protein